MQLQNKKVLITGSTDGLGKMVAIDAAKAGAQLILHGRNKIKGAKVLDEIRSVTKNENVVYYNADLSSLQEVQGLSDRILTDHSQLHILINNAAIGGGPRGKVVRELSADGYELRFAVNYLSHFLLTRNLLPLLERSVPSRIINVASIGQQPIDFSDVMMEKKYDSYTAYCRSKLAQIMDGFTIANQSPVAINSLHPATLMDTNMVHDFFGHASTTIREGAEAVEYVAFSKQTENVTGKYFNQEKISKASAQAYDETARARLLDLSYDLIRKVIGAGWL